MTSPPFVGKRMHLQVAIAAPVPLRAKSIAAVRIWLFVVAAFIFLMVLVGGATRLTESGLSITEWKPVTGALPPLSAADWQAEFDRYRQIPQYAAMNADMTLDGFKSIFWWEWGHRLLARLIGAVFILPALWFWARGELRGELGRRVALATGLLALEPIVGWWMVSSGLAHRTEVAQERLAIHLMIAAATFGVLLYAGVGSFARAPVPASRRFVGATLALALAVFAQLGLGALVAGLRAGRIYPTWPKMGESWIPSEAYGLSPWARSLIDDATTVQLDHRLWAYVVVLFALTLGAAAWRTAPRSGLARRAAFVAAAALAQVALGVATLVTMAPIGLALAHQGLALILFGLAVAQASATRVEAGG